MSAPFTSLPISHTSSPTVNAINDRETPGYTAADYVTSLLSSLRHYDKPARPKTDGAMPKTVWESRTLITHIVYLEGGRVEMDEEAIEVSGAYGRRADGGIRKWASRLSGSPKVFTVGRRGRHRCLPSRRWSGRWRGSWSDGRAHGVEARLDQPSICLPRVRS